MDALIAIFKDFWPQILTGVSVGLIALFNKKIIEWITLLVRLIVIKFKKTFALKLTCPVPGIQESLRVIQAELHSNGGSSLRDAINRIDGNVNKVFDSVTSLQADTDLQSDVLGLAQFKVDVDGNIISSNRSFKKLYGFIDDEGYGHGWVNAVLEEDRDRIFKEWMRAVANKTEYHIEHYIINQTTERKLYVETQCKPIYRYNTRVLIGWTGIVRESTPTGENT